MFLQSHPSIVILGLATPKGDGENLLERMLGVDPGVSVIVVSEFYSADLAVAAIESGACDYLTKPIDVQRLRNRLGNLLMEGAIRQKTYGLEKKLLEAYQFEGIVSRSPLMLEIFTKIRRVAPHFRTALVTGPTGAGKELVAKALHNLGPGSAGEFVVCNCSALVESLESA